MPNRGVPGDRAALGVSFAYKPNNAVLALRAYNLKGEP